MRAFLSVGLYFPFLNFLWLCGGSGGGGGGDVKAKVPSVPRGKVTYWSCLVSVEYFAAVFRTTP